MASQSSPLLFLRLEVLYLKAEAVAWWIEHLASIDKASSSVLSTWGGVTLYITTMKLFSKRKII